MTSLMIGIRLNPGFAIWMIVSVVITLFSLVMMVRSPDEPPSNDVSERDGWGMAALFSVAWPGFVIFFTLKFLWYCFEHTVIFLFGKKTVKQEELSDVIGHIPYTLTGMSGLDDIPDTLLERFQELEIVAKQQTCNHYHGYVIIDDEKCCGGCQLPFSKIPDRVAR